MEIEELKAMIDGLEVSDLEKLKTYLETKLSTEPEEKVEKPVVEPQEESGQVETPAIEPANEEETTLESLNEAKPAVEPATKLEPTTELPPEAKPQLKDESDHSPAIESENAEQIESLNTGYDDIPAMSKNGVMADEENIVDAETNEEMPIDFKQIVDAQNAKILALEAENKELKSKVAGAFGYSSKPGMPAKINRLYDDTEEIHFKKY